MIIRCGTSDITNTVNGLKRIENSFCKKGSSTMTAKSSMAQKDDIETKEDIEKGNSK